MRSVTVRFIFGLMFSTFLSAGLHAQSIALRKAEKHYENLEYKDAADMYETILKDKGGDLKIMRNLANCYFKLNDMTSAEKWFRKVVKSSEANPNDYLYYAEALEENSKYNEAMVWFDKYNKIAGTDKRGKRNMEGLSHLKDYYKDSSNYKVSFINSINTSAAEFSPCYYKKGLLYVSERNHNKFSESTFMWDKSHFLDLYYSELEDAAGPKFGKDHPFNNRMNTKYHEGPVALNQSQDLMVFTRNNYFHRKAKLSDEGINKLMLYYSISKDNKWQAAEKFPYNNDNYSCGHPALSKDGKTMYFVSDMPGSIGGTDIWMSSFDKGSWTKPVNAGPGINSEGNEMFPVLIRDSLLYFASNGLGGLGGLDIFSAELSNGKFSSIKNLGYPINSSHDDFGLIYDPSTESGYFTSSRENKNGGNDDIYFFKLKSYFINIMVIDEASMDPLANAKLTIKDNKGGFTEVKTDAKGKFKIKCSPETDYNFAAAYPEYSDGKSSVSSRGQNADKNLTVVVPLYRMAYRLEAQVSDSKSKQALSDVKITILDKLDNSKTFIDGKTDMKGLISKMLKEKKPGDHVDYAIEYSRSGYLKRKEDFAATLGKDTVVRIPLFLEQIAVGVDIGKVFDLKPIYFDVAKWNIRPDAATELDKIVAAMKDNPGIVIELGSHTDCRASAKYNMILSDKRAKSSAAYIVSKGIDKVRIYGKGYGESKLVNGCACEGKVKSTCSEEEHQMNRRTEFRIVKIKK